MQKLNQRITCLESPLRAMLIRGISLVFEQLLKKGLTSRRDGTYDVRADLATENRVLGDHDCSRFVQEKLGL